MSKLLCNRIYNVFIIKIDFSIQRLIEEKYIIRGYLNTQLNRWLSSLSSNLVSKGFRSCGNLGE